MAAVVASAIAVVTMTAMFGIVALAGGLQGWLLRKTIFVERWMLIAAGLMLIYPAAFFDVIGFGLVAAVIVMQKVRQVVMAPATP